MDGRYPKEAKPLTDLLAVGQQLDTVVGHYNAFVASASASASDVPETNLFRLARHNLNMSQDSFAGALEISQPYLSQLESGKRTPSGEVLRSLQALVKEKTDGNNTNA